jgi:hypothetical protein
MTLEEEETCHDQYGQIWLSYNAVLASLKDHNPAGFCMFYMEDERDDYKIV